MKQSVSALHGAGPRAVEQLQQMGIVTVEDLIEHFPFRYEDHAIRPLNEVQHDERVTVQGKVYSEPELRFFGKKKSRLTVRVFVDGLLVQAVFFNQPYLKKQIQLGDHLVFSGKLDRNRMVMTGGTVKPQSPNSDRLEPVYSVKGDMKVRQLRKLIDQAFSSFGSSIEEILPAQLLDTYKLAGRKQALYHLHFPTDLNSFRQAKRRMIYEELLLFQLKMQLFRKQQREGDKGNGKSFNQSVVNEFVQELPFPLTAAQDKVLKEVFQDLQSPYRMNRLLQGDVGSGKTVVAAIALYANVLAGYQGALMVPTEILAEQHTESLKKLFEHTGLKIAHISGSSRAREKRETLESLQKGDVDIIIGTHALIQEGVEFSNLGLVITDEQHRFGVQQRRVLREKGIQPDVLFMTATPIPRTLAISAFGDMDVSTIDEMPAGRKAIKTHWAKHDKLPRVIDFMKKEIQKGHQVYVICPLIEESEQLDVQNAIDVHFQLDQALPGVSVGLMHGRLPHDEKEQVMLSFAENESQVLVSTTVVEVGVNVPNATLMVIYDADRFGLSQLHQLRGRVGRGDAQAFCVLLADPKTDVGKERMSIMTETNDGFELSQRDLELRGPGDFFGVKQSGLPEFKVADLIEDYRVLEVARQDAAKLVQSSAFWTSEDYRNLRETLQKQGAFRESKFD
ncbi:ATP-dependent DNA helicase RecG [Salipaludibacillus aurantiacus]|uniref:ATP-dependent DNA helicase RecG n=1 Tax=Salipaludibacillus aurantiacus TaxID=1601833 RepID=A0A1H9QP74_9BACI|nr:ATP-dependent DNA helicase RecG [Salipaludibacillus aurantiacus]SER62217.1 ATP-dependent DNA helicase RecG [Salipaludibacillus aurantiacus]